MCSDYRLEVEAVAIFEDFADLKIKIRFSGGTPNIQARQDIRLPIRRRSCARSTGRSTQAISSSGGGAGWGKTASQSTISEGREFTSGRCLIIADGFYEFTDPPDKKKKRKDKWLCTKRDRSWFCIAGIWRANKDVGEAFTMLTMEPGPDIAPYHDRQIVILERSALADWLNPSISAKSIIKPLPAGVLHVEQVG
jgi:putative SOS response-associated peptidase YedK